MFGHFGFIKSNFVIFNQIKEIYDSNRNQYFFQKKLKKREKLSYQLSNLFKNEY